MREQIQVAMQLNEKFEELKSAVSGLKKSAKRLAINDLRRDGLETRLTEMISRLNEKCKSVDK